MRLRLQSPYLRIKSPIFLLVVIPMAMLTSTVSAHGSIGYYTNHKCRCVSCKSGFNAYMNRYKMRKKLKGQCRDCTKPANPKGVRCEKHRVMHKINQAVRTDDYRCPYKKQAEAGGNNCRCDYCIQKRLS